MAIMDMPEIGLLFSLISRVLTPGGAFVFSVTHPCFHSAASSASPRAMTKKEAGALSLRRQSVILSFAIREED